MDKDELERIKKEINLKFFAQRMYHVISNEKGMAMCPFHPEDHTPRLQFWIGRTGIHRFTDHHNEKNGTIVDFVMAMDKCSIGDAIRTLEEEFIAGEEDLEQEEQAPI